jgi:hypothetical protein
VTKGAAPFINNVHSIINVRNVIFDSFILEDRLKRLEQEVRKNFDAVRSFVADLEVEVSKLKKLESLDPTKLIALIEQSRLLEEYKQELDSIDNSMQASEQASFWLEKNRRNLVLYTRDNMFNRDYSLRNFANSYTNQQTVQLFCQDINLYLRWIGHYLHMSMVPQEMPKGVIGYVLPSEIYIEAFKLVRNKISVKTSGLKAESVTMLRSYINRFLIKRDLRIDAPEINE